MKLSAKNFENSGDPVIVCSFGRSGTHLVIDVVRHQFSAFAAWKWPGQSTAELFIPLDEFAEGAYSCAAVARTLARSNRPIARSHQYPGLIKQLAGSQPEFASWLEPRAKTLFVIRDPVIAIPKLWTLASQYRDQRGLDSLNDMDAFVLEQATRWSRLVRSAIAAPRSKMILLEHLLADPIAEVARIGCFLEEPPRFASPFLIRPHRHRLHTLAARLNPCPRSTHVLVRTRSQRRYVFEWTDRRLAALYAQAGAIMERLGYRRPVPG